MEEEQKQRIMKLCIQELKQPGDHSSILDPLDLIELLNHIEKHHQGLFNFATLEQDNSAWNTFKELIRSSMNYPFEIKPNLEQIKHRANKGIESLCNKLKISQLPGDDYYNRPVKKLLFDDLELQELQLAAVKKLSALSSRFFNSPQNALLPEELKAQKDLLEKELFQIQQLQLLRIPNHSGSFTIYCILSEKIDGVTPKISLISLESVKRKLSLLVHSDDLTLEQYLQKKELYKLTVEAIIKLPKYEKVQEVQREAIALNISRLSGLLTTHSMTVSYDEHPALLILFDEIRLLKEYSTGELIKAYKGLRILGISKDYIENSLINPIGEGMHANSFIDDFGNALALMYLCSDPDTIGGYCQNKALMHNKHLFIFDQSIKDREHFILKSSLNLEPIWPGYRQYVGRNKTLIEDSSLENKFNSIYKLQQNRALLNDYLEHVIRQHKERLQFLKQKALFGIEFNEIKALITDAELIQKFIQKQITGIDAVFPKISENVYSEEIKQALVLEKLIHNPVLFNIKGKPYRNPRTETHDKITICSINKLNPEELSIQWKGLVPLELIEAIRANGPCPSLKLMHDDPKTLVISKDDLHKLHEGLLYPEYVPIINPDFNYLNRSDLMLLQKAYKIPKSTQPFLEEIDKYLDVINAKYASVNQKLERIQHTKTILQSLIQDSSFKESLDIELKYSEASFGKQVLKKFYYHSILVLLKLMPEYVFLSITKAFSAAVKLDRISDFHSLIFDAFANNKLNDSSFIDFLSLCITLAEKADNHTEAVNNSLILSNQAEQLRVYYKQSSSSLAAPIRFFNLNKTEKESETDCSMEILKHEYH